MRLFYGLLTLAGLTLAAACSDSSGPSGTPQFSRQITFPDLKTTLQGLPATGAARAEIALPATGFVARRVGLEDPEEMHDPERVRGSIAAITVDASGNKGSLTIEPGFQVSFTMTTVFRAADDTANLTLQQFADRVKAALAMSPQVFLGVVARRAPMSPLALGPADSFPADKLTLKHDVDEPRLKLNVTQVNLVDAGSGDCTMAKLGVPPVGCLKVLGVTVGIGPETKLQEMNPGVVKAEFEGVVDCAKPVHAALDPDGSFFLKGGAEVLVDAHTDVDGVAEGSGEHLTLAQVATSCGAAQPPEINAEGEGVLVSANGAPPMIRAMEVRFEQEELAQIDVEFSGTIDVIALPNITVSGRTVMVDANTQIERADVKIAAADLKVGDVVEVRAVLDSSGALLAREIKVRV